MAVTEQAAASFSHHTRSATVVQVCRTGLTSVEPLECVIDFSIFDLGGLTQDLGRTPGSTILQNFIALRQPTPEISVTKIPADKQKNKQTNSNRYIPSMPIGMWG